MKGKAGWLGMTVLALAVSAYALASSLVPTWRTPFVVELFASKPGRAFAHLGAGGVALAAGAFQFSDRLRRRRLALHRGLGRVYVVAALIAGVSAVLLAPSSSGGLTAHFGFGLLGALWLVATVVAFLRIQSGDLPGHREWMIRSYALCLAAVTLRLYLPLGFAAGYEFDVAYPAIAWLCWVPNLLVAEWVLIPALRRPIRQRV